MIRAAKVEASYNLPNGMGIVKLIGWSSGFIAAHVTHWSSNVVLYLIPNVHIMLEGPPGCLSHLWMQVHEKGYSVVVVAEGAYKELRREVQRMDAIGNTKLPQIGEHMTDGDLVFTCLPKPDRDRR